MNRPESELRDKLARLPRVSLAQLPTPLHRLNNLSRKLDINLWVKRDDLTGLEGGGNKTRKLEFLVGEALQQGADTLVTLGAIQSNHTRQTAAAAAKVGMECALVHAAWTENPGPHYDRVGNILLSSMLGAQLFVDPTPRPIEDQSPLSRLSSHIESLGRKPYVIPGGASDHWLGSFGYMVCAAEIVDQCKQNDIRLDHVVHCTGSSSTQAGLVAGFAALQEQVSVIGVSDDDETEIKRDRILRLANDALAAIELDARVSPADVHVIVVDESPYGRVDDDTLSAIDLLARTEGLVADPVYEAKAMRGLLSLAADNSFEPDANVLLMHLGGSPAVHGYCDRLGQPRLIPLP